MVQYNEWQHYHACRKKIHIQFLQAIKLFQDYTTKLEVIEAFKYIKFTNQMVHYWIQETKF